MVLFAFFLQRIDFSTGFAYNNRALRFVAFSAPVAQQDRATAS